MQPSQISSIPIASIQLADRQRLDYGDIDELAESIKTYGVLQPLLVTEAYELVAGGRRLAAATKAGLQSVPIFIREHLTETQRLEMELEENLRRKDMDWRERCMGIAKRHYAHDRDKAIQGIEWSQKATAELLGLPSVRDVNFSLKLAKLLESELDENRKPKEGARFWPCETIKEAIDLCARDLQDKAMALNAEAFARQATPIEVIEEEKVLLAEFESSDMTEARERYYSNPHNPAGSFEDYWAEKQAKVEQIKQTVYLSKTLIQGDSIAYMHENVGRFDHVITDIPYGIDLDYLDQQNQHGGINNLDQVEELHKVDYNLDLIQAFFPAAFECTKPTAFVVTWCDPWMYRWMADLALNAGFAVQRWPIIWTKPNAMNQCVAYNTTKDYEIALVCRKPGSTIVDQPGTSIIHSGKDELCSEIDHPFCKPFACWKFLIEAFTIKGASILEPFAGRGSGVISMLKLDRVPFGVELDPTHYSYLVDNVKRLHYLPINPNFQFK